jgi:hypothetical protein
MNQLANAITMGMSNVAGASDQRHQLEAATAGVQTTIKTAKASLASDTDPITYQNFVNIVDDAARANDLSPSLVKALVKKVSDPPTNQLIDLIPIERFDLDNDGDRPAWHELWKSANTWLVSAATLPEPAKGEQVRHFARRLTKYSKTIFGDINYTELSQHLARYIAKRDGEKFYRLLRITTKAKWDSWINGSEGVALTAVQTIKRKALLSYIDSKELINDAELPDEVLAALTAPSTTTERCYVRASVLCGDGSRVPVNAAVDTRASVDCMSLARALRDGHPIDESKKQRMQRRGGRHVDDVGAGTTTLWISTTNGLIQMTERRRHRRPRIRDHHRSADDAARAYGRVRVATRFDVRWRATTTAQQPIARPPPIVALLRTPPPPPQSEYRFASRADELYDKIDFDAVPSSSVAMSATHFAADARKSSAWKRPLDHRPRVARPRVSRRTARR